MDHLSHPAFLNFRNTEARFEALQLPAQDGFKVFRPGFRKGCVEFHWNMIEEYFIFRGPLIKVFDSWSNDLKILSFKGVEIGKELRREFIQQKLIRPLSSQHFIYGGEIIHYYLGPRGLQGYPLCGIDFLHF